MSDGLVLEQELRTETNSRAVINVKRSAEAAEGVELVRGFLQSDISINGGSLFSEPFSSAAQESIANKIEKFKASLAGFDLTRKIAKSLKNITFRTVSQSVSLWQGTEKPTFSMDLLFLAFDDSPENDVRRNVARLFETVFPTISGSGRAGRRQIKPPLGYFPDVINARADGTISVFVGTWFRARNMVMQSVNPTFSRETLPNGSPLFATVNIQFRPVVVLTFDDVKKMMSVTL